MMSPFLRAAASAGLMLLARPQAFGGDAEAWAHAGVMLAQPAPANPMEFQQKARIVSILSDYITWPVGSGPSSHQLVIGVVGESPFENYLDDFFAPGKPQSQKGRILYLNNLRAIEDCDVLFICESESDRLYEILRRVKDRPILTIGASPDFARRGVMINLVLYQGRVALEVNQIACKLSRLAVRGSILDNAIKIIK